MPIQVNIEVVRSKGGLFWEVVLGDTVLSAGHSRKYEANEVKRQLERRIA